MSTNDLFIHAAGMACPIGLRWSPACAAMRAGVMRKQVSPYLDDHGRDIVISILTEQLAVEALVEERLLFLFVNVLRDLLEQHGSRILDFPVVVALPPSRRGEPYSAQFLAAGLARLDLHVEPRQIRIVTSDGASGGLRALYEAGELARRGSSCIVAAVDSMMDAHRLHELACHGRLLVKRNPDGLIPGEAAAALLVGTHSSKALAVIRGLGFGEEPARLSNEVPLRAEGLAAAVQRALDAAGLKMHELDFRLADASGESFYFKEQSLLVSRLLRVSKPEFPLWLPAETLGDSGVAAGLVSIAWALAAWDRGYAPGPRALCLAGGAASERAAAVVESARA